MVLDLPSQYDLDFFRKIEVLVAPAGLQDLEYNVTKSIEDYLEEVWVLQKIGITTEHVQNVSYDIQSQRKQYGLRHRFTFTIHAAKGDTLIKVLMNILIRMVCLNIGISPKLLLVTSEQ